MPITKASGNAVAPAAKGDLVAGSATNDAAVLGVGANGTVLTAASGEATGLQWATPSSGGMTLISTTTLTGSSITLSSIPQTYNNLQLVIKNTLPSVDSVRIDLRFNGDTGTRYSSATASAEGNTFGDSSFAFFIPKNDNSVASGLTVATVFDYTNTTTWKMIERIGVGVNGTTTTQLNFEQATGIFNQLGAISSITMFPASGTFTSGTVLLYGVK